MDGIPFMPKVMELIEHAKTCFFEVDLSSIKKPELDFKLSYWVTKNLDKTSYDLRRLFVERVLAKDPTQKKLTVSDVPPIYMLHHYLNPKPTNMYEQIIEQAKKKGKNIAYLESWEEHISTFAGLQFNYQEQYDYFNYFIRDYNPAAIVAGQQAIKAAYLACDLTLGYTPPPNAPTVYHRYRKALGDDRSLKIIEGIKPHLAKGGAFIAVAAIHLSKIISYLKEQGCQIQAMPDPRIIAFKKIYNALYAGQTSWLKKKGFMADINRELTTAQIENYTHAHPQSRTAKAWELAEIHYEQVNFNNSNLFAAIHRYSFEHSSFAFFRRSTNFPNNNYQNSALKIQQASEHSRTGAIRAALST